MKIITLAVAGALAALAPSAFAQAPQTIKIPETVNMPTLEPLVPACADPAADRFIEIDISQRPPAGSTRVQRISAWITADGVLHWPFVMRLRNIGDQPFIGKAGQQRATLTEKDIKAGGREKVLTTTPFERIDAHKGLAVRFEFSAPANDVEKGKFNRTYTLDIKYDKLNQAIVDPRYGDCNLRNNSFTIVLDGGRKEWIYGGK